MAKKDDDLELRIGRVRKETPKDEQMQLWKEILDFYKKNPLKIKQLSNLVRWEDWFGTQEEVEAAIQESKANEPPEPDKEQVKAEMLLKEVNDYLRGVFRLAYSEESQSIDTFRVIDEENKIVKKVEGSASYDTLREAIYRNSNGAVIPIPKLRNMIDIWGQNGERIDYPKIHGWLETDFWVTHRCSIKPVEGPMPTWDTWLNRLNDPKAYAASIYGTLSGKYKGRQVLWVEGVGETRKTFVSNLLAEVFWGETRGAIDGMAVRSSNANFLASNFVDKALIIWDDCANTRALLTEGVKQITMGENGNKVRIERKGKDAYSTHVTSRLWINSNRSPELTGDRQARSRLLYIHVSEATDPPKAGLEQLYRDELPAFLFYAEQCYQEVCPDNYAIQQNQQAIETIDSFENDFYADVIDDVFKVFYLDEDTEVTAQEFKEALEDLNQKYKSPDHVKKARDYLEKRQGITTRKSNSAKKGEPSKVWYIGIGLVGVKPKKSDKASPAKTEEVNVPKETDVPEDTEVSW